MRLVPERRGRWRLLTLKNAAWLFGGLMLVFIVLSAWNEVRPRDPSRERLYQRGSGSTAPAVAPRPAEVVEEQPVTDETSAYGRGSGLLVPAPPPTAPAPVPVAPAEPPRRTTLKEARQRGERVVITGGAQGVSVEATPKPASKTETVVPPDFF